MDDQGARADKGSDERHRGREASSPYPVSRLAPAFHMEDLAARVESSNALVNAVTTRRLELIAEQMRSLRAQAEAVLRDAERDLRLNAARCPFRRKPGQTYHLYRDDQGELFFSMLSPEDWGTRAPAAFEGSFRLEADQSWTPAEETESRDARRFEVLPLLPR
ncbi:MAG: DUF2452 domain-containing protein [Sandaracinaceae bacterium]|jgi:hypothetical protein|nr:DUF2452 domain-containing protein [Sandaracinaceae bacterium]MBP7681977.1 DUF2452 domain-containing protein [Deltaproteobacteria bacterium]MBK6813467.1 DUF2452 domain-containing protein [Sandaracinaceae bacterium]MBK7152958.1 DUF2452 domain-containing protein [Sandaracinaceae bacterium]MBK7773599.1 DUF2452 domain-containing protein [Sandaracinaceae bacterium]